MRNITQFLLMLTLSFYIAFAPAAAYADINDIHQANLDKIKDLEIQLQKRVGDRWTLSPRNKSVGAGVEIGVSQNYPVAVRQTATTVGGAATTSEAVVTAEKIGSKIFTPTAANVAKRFAGGVATNLVAIALYDLLGKAVDYVLDPKNNQVVWTEKGANAYKITISGQNKTFADGASACSAYYASSSLPSKTPPVTVSYQYYAPTIGYCIASGGTFNNAQVATVSIVSNVVPIDNVSTKALDMAKSGNLQAQSGVQEVVNDMVVNNEIDNSYFNDADISNDTYNDVTNNYITNNISNSYPGVQVPTQAEIAQAAQNGQTSITKSHTNSDGSVTSTTTNFTSNNTTTNNTTNNTYNITNITTNNLSKYDGPGSDKPDTPASTTAPSSSPASTPQPTEFPAFCDWAKPVCDFVEWVKQEPDDVPPEPLDIEEKEAPPFDISTLALRPYISLPAQCPPNPSWNFMGGQIVLPLNIVCEGFSMASWLVIAFAWLRALVVVGSTFKG